MYEFVYCPIWIFIFDTEHAQAQIESAAVRPVNFVTEGLVGLYREIVPPLVVTKDQDNFHELIWWNELIYSDFRASSPAPDANRMDTGAVAEG